MLLLAASAAMLFVTGCASETGPNPAVCAAVGTLLGGGAGLAVADRNSDDSDRDEIIGGAVGGVVLGTAGYFLCKAMAKEPAPVVEERVEPAPPPPPPAPPAEERIVLRGVNFDFDKSDIRPDAAVILDEAASVLSGRTGAVTVTGHTDATGPDDYNQGLSERRAESVKAYLVTKGIDEGRLSTSGMGESQPIADNGTREGRALNRRVELNLE